MVNIVISKVQRSLSASLIPAPRKARQPLLTRLDVFVLFQARDPRCKRRVVYLCTRLERGRASREEFLDDIVCAGHAGCVAWAKLS